MKHLTKIFILTALVFNSTFTFSQEEAKPKTNEFFLSFTNLAPLNVGIKYKRQIKNNTFLKVGIIDLSFSTNNYISNNAVKTNFYFSLGVEGGIEFRKKITEHFTFYHGPNINFAYANNFTKIDSLGLPTVKTPSLRGGIPYTFGMLIRLSEHFFLAAEVNPGVYVTYNQYSSKSYNVGTSITANNKLAVLSFAYRL